MRPRKTRWLGRLAPNRIVPAMRSGQSQPARRARQHGPVAELSDQECRSPGCRDAPRPRRRVAGRGQRPGRRPACSGRGDAGWRPARCCTAPSPSARSRIWRGLLGRGGRSQQVSLLIRLPDDAMLFAGFKSGAPADVMAAAFVVVWTPAATEPGIGIEPERHRPIRRDRGNRPLASDLVVGGHGGR